MILPLDLSEIQEAFKDEEIQQIIQKSRITRISESQSINSVRNRRQSQTSNFIDSSVTKSVESEDVAQAGDTLIESESAAVGSVGFDVYLRYFKSIGFLLISFVLIFTLSSEASAVMSNCKQFFILTNKSTYLNSLVWITRWVSDDQAGVDNSVRNFYVIIYGSFGFLLGMQINIKLSIIKLFFSAITYFTAALSFAFGAIRAARNLHARLLYNILRLPLAFFDVTPLGRVVNRFSRDTDMIDAYLPAMMFSWVSMFFNLIGTIFVISYSTPWFLAVVVPLMIAYYFFQKFYIATSRQLKRLESITRSPIYSHFSESVSGQSIIRAYNEEAR